MAIKVTVWNEGVHDATNDRVKELYPKGMHGFIKDFLEKDENIIVRTATLRGPDLLTDELLNDTDVLIWWGHLRHDAIPDEIAEKVKQRVLEGMGFIVLHASRLSKPFKLLMGTSCRSKWRENDEKDLAERGGDNGCGRVFLIGRSG